MVDFGGLLPVILLPDFFFVPDQQIFQNGCHIWSILIFNGRLSPGDLKTKNGAFLCDSEIFWQVKEYKRGDCIYN